MSVESETYVASETLVPVVIEERAKGSRGKVLGRPRKSDLVAKNRGKVKPGKVGRPLGDAAILNEYKARMLNSPKSKKVIQTILNAALDPEHKHQAVAWKLVLDRVAPLAIFEGDVKKASTGNHISITISGVPNVDIHGEEEALDGTDARDEPDEIEAEFEDVTEDVTEETE